MTAAPAEQGADYFSLFGLKPAFFLDMEVLEAGFDRLQRQHHPDRAALSAARAEQAGGVEVERMAADLNQAYRALRSPAGRAHCLLGLMGCQVSPDDPARLSRELLMQQFELRDELERADAPKLDGLRRRADSMLEEIGAEFERAWQRDTTAEAEMHYQRLLFTERFIAAIDEREDLLLDEEAI